MVDLAVARARLTRAAIRRVLYRAWPGLLGDGLLREALPDDLACTSDTLSRALYYLQDRGEVEAVGRTESGTTLHRLTVAGVERVETDPEFAPERATALRMLRLRVLQALDLGHPQPLGVALVGIALAEDADLDLSEPGLRRALAYLEARALIAAKGDAWRITASGIAYLAGEGDPVPGIARPLAW